MKISVRHFGWLSMAIFAVCLTQDGYYIAGDDARAWSPAIGLFFLGWMGMADHGIAWIANPLMVLAWYFASNSKAGRAFVCSALALPIMTSFLLVKNILSDEGGGMSQVTGYGLGFWLWMVSAAVMAMGAGMAYRQSRRVA